MTEASPRPTPSRVLRLASSALRISAAVAGIVGLTVAVLYAKYWHDNHDRPPNPKVQATMLGSAAARLVERGFVGCPTAQQVLDLSEQPERENLRQVAAALDPWGTPYQIRCDLDRVHAYSMGPDRKPGTDDDLHGLR
ncbi:MAG: hypothetical protein QM756_19155 [Polyangiaceae bacterium]